MDVDIVDKEVEEVRSCIINIPKRRVFSKDSKDLIRVWPCRSIKIKSTNTRFTKPSESSLLKYCPLRAMPLRVKNCGKDEVLFSFRQFVRQQNALKHKNKVKLKFQEAHKYISTDLRRRLHVEDPVDDVVAVTDTDKDFFRFINGRQLPDRLILNSQFIMEFYNYRLMKKIEAGYRLDTMLNIDATFQNEVKSFDLSMRRCIDQVKQFDQFISEDYEKSMACLAKWEQVKQAVQLKNVEIETLSSKIFSTTSRLVALDYKYNVEQKYGRFLYYLAPPSWRLQNREFAHSVEIEARGFDFGGYSEEDSFSLLFDKMKQECYRNFVKPALFFTKPSDLRDVFGAVEMQQQILFIHVSRMAPFSKTLKNAIQQIKDHIAQDMSEVISTIETYDGLVNFHLERSNQLEAKFYRVLHGFFYDNVGALDVLKFSLHLEFCYEKVFNDKPINLDIVAMAKDLERHYLDIMFQLESFDGNEVKQAVKDEIIEQKRINKKSKIAARELRLFARLNRDLLIAFAPPPTTINQENMVLPPIRRARKSKAIREKKESVSLPKISDAQEEYLRLFTDWTETEDPALYIHSGK